MIINEDLLYYIWKTKSFDLKNLKTAEGASMVIHEFGVRNDHAGPDFLSARIAIDDIEWVGHVEMHINASEWYSHRHHNDPAYENTILHVVLHMDKPILRKDGTHIPTLELSNRINERSLTNYKRLMHKASWVPCQSLLHDVSSISKSLMLEKAMTERLTEKSNTLLNELDELGGNWYELIYRRIAWAMGLHINAENFKTLAERTPYSIIQKHKDQLFQLEALLFGQAGMLMESLEDDYCKALVKEYEFLRQKFQLTPMNRGLWKYSRLMPAAFPSIRIAQLAAFLHQTDHLDQLLFEASAQTVDHAFKVDLSTYWDRHYTLGVLSEEKKKRIGLEKRRVITINVIAPLLFAYGLRMKSQLKMDQSVQLLESLPPEKNNIIAKWDHYGLKATNAADSQALVQLKKHYCTPFKCLECTIGHAIMKGG